MQMLYVDRVVHFNRTVSRVFPTIHGWTATILRQRQKMEIEAGGFGLGFVEGRIEQPDEVLHEDTRKGKEKETLHSPDVYTSELIGTMSNAASAMSTFLKKLKNAPEDVVQTPRFQAALEMSKFLVTSAATETNTEGPAATSSQANLDESPEWDECLNNMMEAWEMMQEYPSFSMGFTQLV